MSQRDWITNGRGEWYVVVQALLMLSVALAPFLDGGFGTGQTAWNVAAAIVLIVPSICLVVLASLGLGKNLSPFPRPKANGTLVQSGAFAVVRHPIYAGLIGLALGWSALYQSTAAFAVTIVLFLFFDMKSRREEQWLDAKFADYDRYRARVRKLIPFVY